MNRWPIPAPRCVLATTLLALLIAAPATAGHSRGEVWVEGDVYFELDGLGLDGPPTTRRLRLTTGKRVTEAVLSPDGKSVGMIESVAGEKVRTPYQNVDPEEISIAQVDGGARRVLARSPLPDDERTNGDAWFYGLRFSPDSKRIYFHSVCAVVHSCIDAVDVEGQPTKPFRFAGGQILDIVDSGPYAAHVVVSQHRYHAAGGSFEEAVLLSPAGKEVFDIGSAENPRLLADFAVEIRKPKNADGHHPAEAVLRPVSP